MNTVSICSPFLVSLLAAELLKVSAEDPQITLDSPEETTRIVRAEEVRWRRVVKVQPIKFE